MTAPARDLGTLFDPVDMRVESGRSLATTETLASQGTLREVPLLSSLPTDRSCRARNGIRAFRAHGDGLRQDGVRDGDLVIVDAAKPMSRGSVVVASIAGRLAIGRMQRKIGGVVELTPANPESLPLSQSTSETDVVGALAGIIRKRGFRSSKSNATGSRRPDGREPRPDVPSAGTRPPGKIAILRGRLGMLEMTCAGTDNPRLRRALNKEADRVRLLLQNEAVMQRPHRISPPNNDL
jgi:Peptidase S24-like